MRSLRRGQRAGQGTDMNNPAANRHVIAVPSSHAATHLAGNTSVPHSDGNAHQLINPSAPQAVLATRTLPKLLPTHYCHTFIM
ncbi:hypothetical protein Acsp02_71160 [Actinoplanes sp. NBRC 103695]|nr:hypothetical protein Acsp02_71160 [Actinoplanes sp. NBRC 103695]